jgi:4-hydroxy-3-polyprenylbenzoate decarboxylase
MPQRNLPDFLERLGQAGELVRIDAEIDPRGELAEIATRVIRCGGPALLFAAVRGADMPVLANLLGTEERICRALDVDDLAVMTQRLRQVVAPAESEGWFDRLKASPQEAALRKFLPRTIRNGTCQQMVRLGQDIDLGMLPLPAAWPGETDRWLTAAQFWTVDFDAGRRVIGRYDVAAVDRDRLAVAVSDFDEPARLFRQAAGHGRQQ